VFEDTLSKDTSDGADLSGITIKFALVAEQRGNATADERQAADAVAAVTTAVVPLSSNLAAIDFLSSAVDTGTNVMPQVQTFETTWSVLMQRIELFNNIVADIAQVLHAQRLHSGFPRSELHSGSPICVTGLVCYIGCESGLFFLFDIDTTVDL